MHPFPPVFFFFHLKFISLVLEHYAVQKPDQVPFSRHFLLFFCFVHFLYSCLTSCYVLISGIQNGCHTAPTWQEE